MSYERSSALESQRTDLRREDDPYYSDDPEFQRFTEELASKLFTLTTNIGKLSNQVALLGTRKDNERVRERVHNLMEETREGFREGGEGVKKMQGWENVNPSQKFTQQKLSREFQASLQEFQVVQRSALEKQRASATAARTALEEQSEAGSPELERTGGQQEQEQLRLASQEEVDFQDSLIVERESEIRNIEQSVGELNELFRDVAQMVRDDGQRLDIISENVEGVRTDTQGADRELRSAARYQKSARTRACWLLIILAVVLTIVILAVTI